MSIFIRSIEIVITALMGVVVIVVVAETALREVADISLIVTDELSRYLMIWTAMLAAALLVHQEGHVQITLFTDTFGPRVRKVLYLGAQLVVLAFLAMLVIASAMMLPSVAQQNTVTLGISMAWFYAALPVAGVLMFLFALRNLARCFFPSAPEPTNDPDGPS